MNPARKGRIFVMQYIKNLEDQLLINNYPIAIELIKERKKINDILKCLFYAIDNSKNPWDVNMFKTLMDRTPEQKFGIEWMEGDGQFRNEGNHYEQI
jgi:hypothetical protein